MIDEVIRQIGVDGIKKSLGDIGIAYCDVHGSYSYDRYQDTREALCPLCPHIDNNGTTATAVEHYINVQPIKGTNPHQHINPLGL